MKSIDYEGMQEQISHRNFEYFARSFFERWQPKDPQDAHQFSAELFTLVRKIFMDAQEPLIKHLAQTQLSWPNQTCIKKDGK